MPEISYRLFLNDEPATQEWLDAVETISIEQEMDMAWEARLEMPITLDESGQWDREDEDYMRSFSRIRVEIKIGENDFIPLIDGPVTGSEGDRQSQPGQSTMTLIVQDDSIHLNRDEDVVLFEDRLDHEIARELFESVPEIATTEIDETLASGSSLPSVDVQRGTAIQMLRRLARRQGMHAYVLPGENPGESIGCFREVPTDEEELPALKLFGADRTLESFRGRHSAQRPGQERTSTIRIRDKQIITGSSQSTEPDLMGDESTMESSETEPADRIRAPGIGETVDLDRTTAGSAHRSLYSDRANGQVRTNCYAGVLRPYRLVTIEASNTANSGQYLITQVTHRLTRSEYTQSFSCIRNARSTVSESGQDSPVRGRP